VVTISHTAGGYYHRNVNASDQDHVSNFYMMNLLLIDKYFHIEVLYYNGTNCKQWLTLQFKHLWYLVTSCYNPDGTLFQREVLMHNKWPDANPTSNNQKSVDGTY
jgi:hypothetical protein